MKINFRYTSLAAAATAHDDDDEVNLVHVEVDIPALLERRYRRLVAGPEQPETSEPWDGIWLATGETAFCAIAGVGKNEPCAWYVLEDDLEAGGFCADDYTTDGQAAAIRSYLEAIDPNRMLTARILINKAGQVREAFNCEDAEPTGPTA